MNTPEFTVSDPARERDLAVSEAEQAVDDLQERIDGAKSMIDELLGTIMDAKSALEILNAAIAGAPITDNTEVNTIACLV